MSQIFKKKYGDLSVLEIIRHPNKTHTIICECVCGKILKLASSLLSSGRMVSCGCMKADRIRKISSTHGMSKTRIYRTWNAMKSRCYNINNRRYKDYGGRGISICEEWLDFEKFYKWAMDNGYEENLTIERKNNDLGYFPKNCTFIPHPHQSKNRTNIFYVNLNGEEVSLAKAARILGINRSTLKSRLDSGWNEELALSAPLNSIRTYPKSLVKKTTMLITYKGKTQSLKKWAKELGIKYPTLWKRIKVYNIPPIEALEMKNWRDRGSKK